MLTFLIRNSKDSNLFYDPSHTTPTAIPHIKRQHQDAIVFFRLGDFYETFDEDARITSRELDIVLTSRRCPKASGSQWRNPHHAVEITFPADRQGLSCRHLRTNIR